jgi:hypothetical protein
MKKFNLKKCNPLRKRTVETQKLLYHRFYFRYHPITYYWTVPLILDHSYLVGKLTNSKIADTKVSGF